MKWVITGHKAGAPGRWKIEAESEGAARGKATAAGVTIEQLKAAGLPISPLPPPVPVAAIQYAEPIPARSRDVSGQGVSGFGIASLVIGIVSVLLCWVPLLGMLSIPMAVIGLLLGIAGFVISMSGRKSSIGLPVAGTSTCLLAIIVAVAVSAMTNHIMAKTMVGIANKRSNFDAQVQSIVQKQKSEQIRSMSILSIEYLRPATGQAFGTELRYKISNATGKKISAFDGNVRIADQFGDSLEGLELKNDEAIEIGGSLKGSQTWVIGDRTKNLLASGKAKVAFEATRVLYADGMIESFGH